MDRLRQDSGLTEREVKPFDWTFTTDYMGNLEGDWIVEATDLHIDLDRLRQREEILFYHELNLFEDELHDNGIATFSVKIVSILKLMVAKPKLEELYLLAYFPK